MSPINNYIFSSLFFLVVWISSCDKNKTTSGGNNPDPTDPIEHQNEYANPVFQPVLADPSVIRDSESGLFYAYGTEDDWSDGRGRRSVPVLQSENLVDWKYIGEAFNSRPGWKLSGGIWAPDINKINDTYYLYYAFSEWGDANPGIGVATSKDLRGPFIDRGKVFDSKSIGVPNSIDPFLYTDENEQIFLFWGSYSNEPNQGTYVIRLENDGLKIKEGEEKIKIAAGDFEAVTIHHRNNYFYFFGSKGSCCDGANSSYHVMVARSENLTGPYTDKDGNSILNRGAGTDFILSNARFKGPGHTSGILTDSQSHDWILYHAINPKLGKLPNGTTRRMLMLDRVRWEDGWPFIEDGTPSISLTSSPRF